MSSSISLPSHAEYQGDLLQWIKAHLPESNMYGDSILQWNAFKGCLFTCTYCTPSFKAQSKRHKHRCLKCYYYSPHLHPERLNPEYVEKHFPKETKRDEFIWACSSGDIAFAEKAWMDQILKVVEDYSHLTFFFQTKSPKVFKRYNWPENTILGITLETNKDHFYSTISNAPVPSERKKEFLEVAHPRKSITMEPALEFDLNTYEAWVREIGPERFYAGYDTKKCYLPEPPLDKTLALMDALRDVTKVKPKLIRESLMKTVTVQVDLDNYSGGK